jgi:glycosyltransferase involved in cell wall biosynthesis
VKVAIIGTRGIPARYGGFETLAEELSRGLVRDHGMEVTVYCRNSYYDDRPPRYNGVECIYLPSPRAKGLESILHTFLSSAHALTRRFDILFIVDPANAPVAALLTMLGQKVVIHTDGLGWKRRKWGPLSRRYYRWVEWVSARFVGTLITDNPAMREYYRRTYGADSVYVSYGADNRYGTDTSILGDLGLLRRSFLLVVARLEPENNTDLIIREFVSSGCPIPLVIVGDAPYSRTYLADLHRSADGRVIFAGRIDDQGRLNGLYGNAYLYVHGHEVGGTNPSLLRAMGSGTAPLVLDVPFNRSVVGDSGFSFTKEKGHLARILNELSCDHDEVEQKGKQARALVESDFRWPRVVSDYARLFQGLAAGK